jgi:flagellar secretion chaperone FliS
MNAANSLKSYRRIATKTAPPGQLILMLFDGALLCLERALIGFEHRDPGEKNQAIHNNLRRAADIIRHLNNSLNLEAGGELAGTLRRLYHYFDMRLTESNLKKQRAGVDEVIVHLKELRDAWATMLANRSQENGLQGEEFSDESKSYSALQPVAGTV